MQNYWLYLLFGLQGRIPRKLFWVGNIVVLGFYFSVYAPLFIFWTDDVLQMPSALWVRQIVLAADLALAWPVFAINAKRQQDHGQWPWLAWLCLVATISASVLELAGVTETADGFTFLGQAILWFLGLVILAVIVELGFRKGTAGPNAYGPDPLSAH